MEQVIAHLKARAEIPVIGIFWDSYLGPESTQGLSQKHSIHHQLAQSQGVSLTITEGSVTNTTLGHTLAFYSLEEHLLFLFIPLSMRGHLLSLCPQLSSTQPVSVTSVGGSLFPGPLRKLPNTH